MLTLLPLRVRIRTEPIARAAVVATASSGETLQLVEDQGAWVRVQKEVGLVEYRFAPDSFEVRHVRAPGQIDVGLDELLGKAAKG